MLIAYHRGRLPTERGINDGLMAATGLSAAEAIERTAGTKVGLACDNSPSSTTVSGPAEDVRAFLKELDAEGIFARALDTNGVPYHSPRLEPLLPELDSGQLLYYQAFDFLLLTFSELQAKVGAFSTLLLTLRWHFPWFNLLYHQLSF